MSTVDTFLEKRGSLDVEKKTTVDRFREKLIAKELQTTPISPGLELNPQRSIFAPPPTPPPNPSEWLGRGKATLANIPPEEKTPLASFITDMSSVEGVKERATSIGESLGETLVKQFEPPDTSTPFNFVKSVSSKMPLSTFSPFMELGQEVLSGAFEKAINATRFVTGALNAAAKIKPTIEDPFKKQMAQMEIMGILFGAPVPLLDSIRGANAATPQQWEDIYEAGKKSAFIKARPSNLDDVKIFGITVPYSKMPGQPEGPGEVDFKNYYSTWADNAIEKAGITNESQKMLIRWMALNYGSAYNFVMDNYIAFDVPIKGISGAAKFLKGMKILEKIAPKMPSGIGSVPEIQKSIAEKATTDAVSHIKEIRQSKEYQILQQEGAFVKQPEPVPVIPGAAVPEIPKPETVPPTKPPEARPVQTPTAVPKAEALPFSMTEKVFKEFRKTNNTLFLDLRKNDPKFNQLTSDLQAISKEIAPFALKKQRSLELFREIAKRDRELVAEYLAKEKAPVSLSENMFEIAKTKTDIQPGLRIQGQGEVVDIGDPSLLGIRAADGTISKIGKKGLEQAIKDGRYVIETTPPVMEIPEKSFPEVTPIENAKVYPPEFDDYYSSAKIPEKLRNTLYKTDPEWVRIRAERSKLKMTDPKFASLTDALIEREKELLYPEWQKKLRQEPEPIDLTVPTEGTIDDPYAGFHAIEEGRSHELTPRLMKYMQEHDYITAEGQLTDAGKKRITPGIPEPEVKPSTLEEQIAQLEEDLPDLKDEYASSKEYYASVKEIGEDKDAIKEAAEEMRDNAKAIKDAEKELKKLKKQLKETPEPSPPPPIAKGELPSNISEGKYAPIQGSPGVYKTPSGGRVLDRAESARFILPDMEAHKHLYPGADWTSYNKLRADYIAAFSKGKYMDFAEGTSWKNKSVEALNGEPISPELPPITKNAEVSLPLEPPKAPAIETVPKAAAEEKITNVNGALWAVSEGRISDIDPTFLNALKTPAKPGEMPFVSADNKLTAKGYQGLSEKGEFPVNLPDDNVVKTIPPKRPKGAMGILPFDPAETEASALRTREQIQDLYNAGKTAISRIKESIPARLYSIAKGDKVLDYGSGKGKDIEFFRTKEADVVGYDKYNQTDALNTEARAKAPFDKITNTYVLNVVPRSVQEEILDDIVSLLKPEGDAYFAVRSEKEVAGIKGQRIGEGVQTSKGTYQEGFTGGKLKSLLETRFENVEIIKDSGGNVVARASKPILSENIAKKGVIPVNTESATEAANSIERDFSPNKIVPDPAGGFMEPLTQIRYGFSNLMKKPSIVNLKNFTWESADVGLREAAKLYIDVVKPKIAGVLMTEDEALIALKSFVGGPKFKYVEDLYWMVRKTQSAMQKAYRIANAAKKLMGGYYVEGPKGKDMFIRWTPEQSERLRYFVEAGETRMGAPANDLEVIMQDRANIIRNMTSNLGKRMVAEGLMTNPTFFKRHSIHLSRYFDKFLSDKDLYERMLNESNLKGRSTTRGWQLETDPMEARKDSWIGKVIQENWKTVNGRKIRYERVLEEKSFGHFGEVKPPSYSDPEAVPDFLWGKEQRDAWIDTMNKKYDGIEGISVKKVAPLLENDLKSLGLIHDISATVGMQMLTGERNIALAKFFNWLKIQPDLLSKEAINGWKEIPATKAMGDLSGMYAHPQVFDALRFFSRLPSRSTVNTINFLNKIYGPWKTGKVILDTAVQFANAVSNMGSLYISGDILHLKDGFRMIKNKDAAYKLWDEMGGGSGGFHAGEIIHDIMPYFEAMSKDLHPYMKSVELARVFLKDKIGYAAQAYSYIEDVSKATHFLSYLKKEGFNNPAKFLSEGGVIPEETLRKAIEAADYWQVRYSDAPDLVKLWSVLPGIGKPFLTYYYYMFPRITGAFMGIGPKGFDPLIAARAWSIPTALGIVGGEYSRQKLGLSRDEEREIYRQRPEWQQEGFEKYLDMISNKIPVRLTLSPLLPFTGKRTLPDGTVTEDYYFLPTGRFLPGGMSQNFSFSTGDPIFNTIYSVMTEKDVQTGFSIKEKFDEHPTLKVLSYIWRQLGPNLVGGGSFQKVVASAIGQPDWAGRKQNFGMALLGALAGIKPSPADVYESYQDKLTQVNRDISDRETQVRRLWEPVTSGVKEDTPKLRAKIDGIEKERLKLIINRINMIDPGKFPILPGRIQYKYRIGREPKPLEPDPITGRFWFEDVDYKLDRELEE